jgi:hypothetical protein
MVWHKVDTVIVTGGSTSGCVRGSIVESLSRGYRSIVPIECVADKHEGYLFANLTDMVIKYADVLVLECDAVPRGSTALSCGLIPVAGTRWQVQAGVEETPLANDR